MAKQSAPFKVIIIGSSIVGLTLAHCLDHAGIDYVVLEKNQDVHPQLGAFIGIMPNGARVLEQLGLYDTVKDISESMRVHHSVHPDGFVFTDLWPAQMTKRLGLSLLILSRQQLLTVLYNGLKDKSRIRLGKKVVEIRHQESVVSALTDDGDVYHGDMAVGADGVHSITRSELWRIANRDMPGIITTKDRSALVAEYSGIFGMSTAVPGIKPGEQIVRSNNNAAILIFGGKGDSVGWGAMRKLDQKYTYPHIPRYTQDDAVATAKALANQVILNDVKFGDIWDRRYASSMTTLEEGMLQSWYHGRIVCIGDSSNKMTPNIAQGANTGIESAAELANRLYLLVQSKEPEEKPSDSEIANTLADLEQRHFSRLKPINSLSYAQTRIQTRDGLLNRVAGRYIAPYTHGLTLYIVMKMVRSSTVLEYMPPPASTQKQQDLLKTSKKTNPLSLAVISVLAITVAFLSILIWIPLGIEGKLASDSD